MQMSTEGLEQWAQRLDKLGVDITSAVDEGFDKAQDHVNTKLRKEMRKHIRTGETINSIVDGNKTVWLGKSVAARDVGFEIRGANGVNLRSVYLMYGTIKQPKNTRLYNALYGPTTRREIRDIQADVMLNYIIKNGG